MGVFLALVSSIVVGASDFLGGLASRRASTLTATVWSYVGAVALTIVAALASAGVWSRQTVVAGCLAGIFTIVGFLTFYASLSLGRMAVSASLVAAIQATVPAIVALTWGGERLGLLGMIGAGLAVAGAITLGWAEGHDEPQTASPRSTESPARGGSRLPTVLAAVSGISFGGTVVSLHGARADAGPLAALVEMVLGLVAVLGLFGAARRLPSVATGLRRLGIEGPAVAPADHRSAVRIGLAAGVLLGAANLALVAALRIGPLAPVGVVSATYSMTTTVLAVLVLRERLRPLHVLGIGAGLLGCALLGIR